MSVAAQGTGALSPLSTALSASADAARTAQQWEGRWDSLTSRTHASHKSAAPTTSMMDDEHASECGCGGGSNGVHVRSRGWTLADSFVLAIAALILGMLTYLMARVTESLSILGITANPNFRTLVVLLMAAVVALAAARYVFAIAPCRVPASAHSHMA